MKAKIFRSWRLALVVGGLPFMAGSLQNFYAIAQDSPPEVVIADTPVSMPEPSAPAAPLNVKLSASAAQVVKLAQSATSDDVILAYIDNVKSYFALGSDQIVYLNDIGISGAVVKAMIQRDAAITAEAAQPVSAPPPTAPPPFPPDNVAAAPPEDDSVATIATDDSGDYSTVEDTAYFYDSLAPYGSWVYVSGVGRCWQPTVYVGNHDWRPYGDRGRWLFTDSGWYWQSDYSWGWAAFHYGRWFRDQHVGWVWAPDRVWGPAWVSWRHSPEYCGWAPLPPAARFVAGTGFRYGRTAVTANFEFGLRARQYTFIPIARMTDYSPTRYSMMHSQAAELYKQTVVNNDIKVENHRVVSRSIDPQQVAKYSGSEVRRAEIREMPAQGGKNAQPDHVTKSDDKTVIYRPHLPAPDFVHAARVQKVNSSPVTPQPKPVILTPQRQAAPAANVTTTYPANSLIITGEKNNVAEPVAPQTPLPNMNLSHWEPTHQTTVATPQPTVHATLPPVPTAIGASRSSVTPPHYSRGVYYPGSRGVEAPQALPAATPEPQAVTTYQQTPSPDYGVYHRNRNDSGQYSRVQSTPTSAVAPIQPQNNNYTPQPTHYQQPTRVQVPEYYHPATPVATPVYHAPQPENHPAPILTPPAYQQPAHVETHSALAPTPAAAPTQSSSSTISVPSHGK